MIGAYVVTVKAGTKTFTAVLSSHETMQEFYQFICEENEINPVEIGKDVSLACSEVFVNCDDHLKGEYINFLEEVKVGMDIGGDICG